MNFLGRLKYYLLGFGLGCIVVWATLYKDRDRPSWLPQGRILEFLERTTINMGDQVKCKLECHQIPNGFMDKKFWKNASVDFEKSATKRKPCPEYYITGTLENNQKIILYIESCETCENCSQEGSATLRNFELENSSQTCNCGE
ncbi:MAG: hypothetical protein IT232_12475 [Flavobacteriales bacterium]|nr:hypothetical protein [Flavobacteriales bacterium]